MRYYRCVLVYKFTSQNPEPSGAFEKTTSRIAPDQIFNYNTII